MTPDNFSTRYVPAPARAEVPVEPEKEPAKVAGPARARTAGK